MGDKVISIKDLSKEVEGRQIFQHFDLEIEKGGWYFFHSSSVKGKTLLFKMLLGIVRPDSGKVEVFHKDPFRVNIRKRIGFFTLPPLLIEKRSVENNIKFTSEALGLKEDMNRILRLFNIENVRRKKAKFLSFRERVLVAILRELAKLPEILILDDPFHFMERSEIERLFNYIEEKRMTFLAGSMKEEVGYEKFIRIDL